MEFRFVKRFVTSKHCTSFRFSNREKKWGDRDGGLPNTVSLKTGYKINDPIPFLKQFSRVN